MSLQSPANQCDQLCFSMVLFAGPSDREGCRAAAAGDAGGGGLPQQRGLGACVPGGHQIRGRAHAPGAEGHWPPCGSLCTAAAGCAPACLHALLTCPKHRHIIACLPWGPSQAVRWAWRPGKGNRQFAVSRHCGRAAPLRLPSPCTCPLLQKSDVQAEAPQVLEVHSIYRGCSPGMPDYLCAVRSGALCAFGHGAGAAQGGSGPKGGPEHQGARWRACGCSRLAGGCPCRRLARPGTVQRHSRQDRAGATHAKSPPRGLARLRGELLN